MLQISPEESTTEVLNQTVSRLAVPGNDSSSLLNTPSPEDRPYSANGDSESAGNSWDLPPASILRRIPSASATSGECPSDSVESSDDDDNGTY